MIRFVKYIILLLFTANLFAETTIDTLNPEVKIYGDCGYYTVNITEMNNGNQGDNPRQIDRGVSRMPVLDGDSYNFKSIRVDENFTKGSANYDFNIFLEVKNKFKPAFAVFVVIDDANPPNILFDSIKYEPELITFNPTSIEFPNTRLNTESKANIVALNATLLSIEFDSVYFAKGEFFRSPLSEYDEEFKPNMRQEIDIFYQPQYDILDTQVPDYDTLIIKTRCLEYRIPVLGRGVMPKISVRDHNFGWHFKGDFICKFPLMFPDYDEGLIIYNPGSDTLRLSGFYHLKENSPLLFTDATNPSISNFKIPPGDSAEVVRLCFEPKTQGEFFNRVYFKSNAYGPDSICNIYGVSFIRGPHFTDITFPSLRVGASSRKTLEFRNNGDVPVSVKSFYLEGDNSSFEIIEDEIFPAIPSSGFITVYPDDYDEPHAIKSIEIPVRFNPDKENNLAAKIRADFVDEVRNDTSDVYNNITGHGFIPKIKTQNYTFSPPVMINTLHSDTAHIQIKNISHSGSLFIEKVSIIDYLSTDEDFIILDDLPENKHIDKNSSISFRILFKPLSLGEKYLVLMVKHDAGTLTKPQLKDTTIRIMGTGYKNLEIPSEIRFNNLPHCISDYKFFNIKNLSKVDTIHINRIEIINNDFNVFQIDKNKLTLLPGQTDSLRVNIYPYLSNNLYNYAYLKLHNHDDIYNINLVARSNKTEVFMTIDTLRNISPGLRTQYYEGTDASDDFRVNIYSKHWDDTYIDEIQFDLYYLHNSLRFSGVIETGDFDYEELVFDDVIYDDSLSKLNIYIRLTEPIKNNGTLIKPIFEILLGHKLTVRSSIDSVNFFNWNDCVSLFKRNGLITLKGCNIDIRRVFVSPHFYEDMIIKPNPANTETVSISYTLGLKNPTRIELLSTSGAVADVLLDKVQKAGRYELNLSTGDYPSGTYTIRLVSGPFINSEKFIILK